jgi:hypothetical protein
VSVASPEQAELHAEPSLVGPAHDGWQAKGAFRSGQAELDGKLVAERYWLARLEVHATDADVFGAPLERGPVATVADDDRVDDCSRMTALFDHDLLRTLRLGLKQRPSSRGGLVRSGALEGEVRHGR